MSSAIVVEIQALSFHPGPINQKLHSSRISRIHSDIKVWEALSCGANFQFSLHLLFSWTHCNKPFLSPLHLSSCVHSHHIASTVFNRKVRFCCSSCWICASFDMLEICVSCESSPSRPLINQVVWGQNPWASSFLHLLPKCVPFILSMDMAPHVSHFKP